MGSKLILNKNSNMIILKPYIIFDILNHIKYASTPNAKIEITEKLQWILSRLHINAYIISNKSLLKEFKTEHTIAFMAEFMNLLLSNNREIKFTDNALGIINTIHKINSPYLETSIEIMNLFLVVV